MNARARSVRFRSVRFRGARALRSSAGFSFVEILIVMGIIAVLAGLGLVVVNVMARKKPVIETEDRINRLTAAAEDLKFKWGGTYPPTSVKAIPLVSGAAFEVKKLPNATNEGIESLYQSIYAPGSGIDPQISDVQLSNTDEDEMEKPIGRGKTLDEVKDGWGNPLIYFPFTEYAAAFEKPHVYVTGEGASVEAKPWKTERGFENPKAIQIFSMGPDGQPNTDDDLKGW